MTQHRASLIWTRPAGQTVPPGGRGVHRTASGDRQHDEVAVIRQYLAFEDASAITGAVVAVDGGLTSCFEYRDEKTLSGR